ncbi:hypothetical protein Nmel_011280 [Mimus melanotis]
MQGCVSTSLPMCDFDCLQTCIHGCTHRNGMCKKEGGCADVSLLAHLSDVPHWSLVQACSSPAPWLSTSSPIAPWQAQSLPHPERAFPTHSIHSGTLLTPSRTPRQPPAPVSMPLLGMEQAGWSEQWCCNAGWLQDTTGTVLCVLFQLQQRVKGYFTASKVLWSWDSCCKAYPCSQLPPGALDGQ